MRQDTIEDGGGGAGSFLEKKEEADGGRREGTVMDEGRGDVWK